MNDLEIIDEHIIIRETIGYEKLAEIEVHDIPNVLKFLKMVYNYNNIQDKIKMLKSVEMDRIAFDCLNELFDEGGITEPILPNRL